MILTAQDVQRLDEIGHPLTECLIIHKPTFHEYVASVVNRFDYFYSGRNLGTKVLDAVISKKGNVQLQAVRRGEPKWLRSSDNHVFLQHQIPNTFEFDIFEGRQNKGRWNLMMKLMEELRPSFQGWTMERLALDAYGEKKHTLYIVFSDELDSILFAATFSQGLQKLGLKSGRK